MRRRYNERKRQRNPQQISQANSYYNDRHSYAASIHSQPPLYNQYIPPSVNTDNRTMISEVTHQPHFNIPLPPSSTNIPPLPPPDPTR